MKNLLFLFAAFHFLQSCTSVTLHLPESRLESPETNGGLFKVGLGGSLAGSHDVTIIQDASSRPPTTNVTTISRDSQASLYVNSGITNFLDLELRSIEGGSEILAKIQFLGAHAMTAKAGNFSIAATFGVGSSSSSANGTQDVIFGPADANWNASAHYTMTDLAVILGYRPSNSTLLFGGPFYTKYQANATIHQDAIASSQTPAADYSQNDSGTGQGANFAAKFNFGDFDNWSFTIEGVYSVLKWDNSSSVSDATYSFAFGYLF